MRTPTLPFLLALTLFLCLPTPSSGQLRQLETEDLRLVYLHPAYDFLVPHAARCFENSMRLQRSLFDYTPSEKVTVFLYHG